MFPFNLGNWIIELGMLFRLIHQVE